MSNENILACASFIVLYSLLKKKERVKRKKRYWSSQLYMKRGGISNNYLTVNESGQFRNFAKISEKDFDLLLHAIKGRISKNDTTFRKAIPPKDRLAVTLCFLATGYSFTSLQYIFKISKQLISDIVPKVCQAIVEYLTDYLKIPSSSEEWMKIAEKFEDMWNFPKCLGAVDGRYIILQAPITSRNDSCHNKSHFSMVLMGVADADYNFIFIDIYDGKHILNSDVLKKCELYKKMESGFFNLPERSAANGKETKLPYVFVGNEAFALSEYIMKPYIDTHPNGSPEQIYNWQLRKAHHVIENAFGIASTVFRVLRKPMILDPQKAELIVKVVSCLHNFLRRSETSRNIYTPQGSLDVYLDGQIKPGSWRNDQLALTSLLPLKHILISTQPIGQEIRNQFIEYFNTD